MAKNLLAILALLTLALALSGCGKEEGSKGSSPSTDVHSGNAARLAGGVKTALEEAYALYSTSPPIARTPLANAKTPDTFDDGCGSGTMTVTGSSFSFNDITVMAMADWETDGECDGSRIVNGVVDRYRTMYSGDAIIDVTVKNKITKKTSSAVGTVATDSYPSLPHTSHEIFDITVDDGVNAIELQNLVETEQNGTFPWGESYTTITYTGTLVVNGKTFTVSTPVPLEASFIHRAPNVGQLLFDGDGKALVTFVNLPGQPYACVQVDADEDGEYEFEEFYSLETLAAAGLKKI